VGQKKKKKEKEKEMERDGKRKMRPDCCCFASMRHRNLETLAGQQNGRADGWMDGGREGGREGGRRDGWAPLLLLLLLSSMSQSKQALSQADERSVVGLIAWRRARLHNLDLRISHNWIHPTLQVSIIYSRTCHC
jgi:hypothetical protein